MRSLDQPRTMGGKRGGRGGRRGWEQLHQALPPPRAAQTHAVERDMHMYLRPKHSRAASSYPPYSHADALVLP